MTNWNEDSDGSLEFAAPAFRADRFYVYIAWGEDRTRPLYIGKGNKPLTRIGLHLGSAKWVSEVRSFECHAFLTSDKALEAETDAIYELNPIYNVIRLQPRWLFYQNLQALVDRQEADRIANEAARKADKPPRVSAERIVSPHPRKRLRRAKWDDDLFTPDQLAIIQRVQNLGRSPTP